MSSGKPAHAHTGLGADPGPPDPQLKRTSRRLGISGAWFLAIFCLLVVPGLLLFFLTSGWPFAIGIVLIALSIAPLSVATGLLAPAAVADWAAHRRPFA